MEKIKNCWLIPTDKPSKLFFNHIKRFEKYQFSKEPFINGFTNTSNYHVYITNDSDIKKGDWVWHLGRWHLLKVGQFTEINESKGFLDAEFCINGIEVLVKDCKNIILTTDQDLIQDGVQSIDDDFLQWLVNNPKCEEVEIKSDWEFLGDDYRRGGEQTLVYKIIIPSEEPNYNMKQEIIDEMERLKVETKQETLEEHIKEVLDGYDEIDISTYKMFIELGAEWMQKQMFSEEEVNEIISESWLACEDNDGETFTEAKKRILEQFKKK